MQDPDEKSPSQATLSSSSKQKMAQGHRGGRAEGQTEGWGTGCCTSNRGTYLPIRATPSALHLGTERLLWGTTRPPCRGRVPRPPVPCIPPHQQPCGSLWNRSLISTLPGGGIVAEGRLTEGSEER